MRRTLALAAFVTLASSTGTASAQTRFWMRPEVGLQAGRETFELSLTVPSTTFAGTIEAKSTLTYPKATTMVGGSAGLAIGPFALVGMLRTNVHDPWGKMTDQDFINAEAGNVHESIEFSHSDSKTTTRSLVAEGAIRLRVATVGSSAWPFHAVLGFRWESNVYDIYGATGWQLDRSGGRVSFSLADSIHALHYQTKYGIPFAGARLDALIGEALLLGLEARVLVAFSSHDDDHLLRFKRAHAATTGVGASIIVEPRWDLGGSSLHAYLGIATEIFYLRSAGGTLTQKYYADDPSLPGDQSQQPIPDANFFYDIVRAQMLATFEVSF